MLGWYVCMIWWICILIIWMKSFILWFILLLLLCVLLCGTLSCDDHQLVGVSRCEEHPRATRRWWFHCIICMGLFLVSLLDFSLGLRPMYLFVLGSTYFLCKLFIQFSFGHHGVPWICKELSFKLQDYAITLSFCNASFNFVY